MRRVHRDTGQRERVLRAVMEAVAERGLADTRISDVADRAGMTKSHVLYYVRSRNEMFQEALGWVEESLATETGAALCGIADPLDRLRRMLELAAPTGPEDARWILWLAIWERSPHDPEVARLATRFDHDWATLLASQVRTAQAAGAIRDVDADEFALYLSALIDGLAIQVVSGSPDMNSERMLQLVWRVVEAYAVDGAGDGA
jgi:AcrR family transcriptional regulator